MEDNLTYFCKWKTIPKKFVNVRQPQEKVNLKTTSNNFEIENKRH